MTAILSQKNRDFHIWTLSFDTKEEESLILPAIESLLNAFNGKTGKKH